MSKKVLILSGSPRKSGNSDLLCDEFLKGADEAGHEVEKIFLRDKKIACCMGCCSCYHYDNDTSSGVCAIKDDMEEIYEKMCLSDVIVMASPVYFYSICAGMKTVIDRCFAKCLEGSVEKGVIRAKGVYEKGEVKGTKYMEEAYEMGKSID